MLDQFTAADFHPRVGEGFQLIPEGGEPLEAELVEVVEHTVEPGEQHRPPFSIFFNAPVGTLEPQGTFTVRHAELGSHEIFLVPVEHDHEANGMLYEAVFG